VCELARALRKLAYQCMLGASKLAPYISVAEAGSAFPLRFANFEGRRVWDANRLHRVETASPIRYSNVMQ